MTSNENEKDFINKQIERRKLENTFFVSILLLVGGCGIIYYMLWSFVHIK